VRAGRHHHAADRAAGPQRFEDGIPTVQQIADRPLASWPGVCLVGVAEAARRRTACARRTAPSLGIVALAARERPSIGIIAIPPGRSAVVIARRLSGAWSTGPNSTGTSRAAGARPARASGSDATRAT
jgi:hypothetical protein